MKHIVDVYKDWQPENAAYTTWTDPRQRQNQAINEMVSEAGEVLGVVTKATRKGKPIDRQDIVDELGDTFWGLVGVMNQFDISWKELCDYNMEKLNGRYGKPAG